MAFLTFAWESGLLSRELAFKFSAILGAIFFLLILIKTNLRSKQRPILILCLFAGYMAFQCLLPTEFFPLSAFSTRSYPESKTARYVKFQKVMEGGDVEILGEHPIRHHFSSGRAKRAWTGFFRNQKACDRFSRAYSLYDFDRDPKVGRPLIRELVIESWKWDWVHAPLDPDHGFQVERLACKA